MERRRWFFIGAALLTVLVPVGAKAEPACNASAVHEALDRLADALGKPKAQAAMKAARDDYAKDQKFDNEDDFKYLAGAAIYLQAKENLDAGGVDDACAMLQNAGKLIGAVVAGE